MDGLRCLTKEMVADRLVPLVCVPIKTYSGMPPQQRFEADWRSETAQLQPEESSFIDDRELHDLVVIGAGPHSLTLLCRLVDDEPDLMTEAARIHIMQKSHQQQQGKHRAGREAGCGRTNREVRTHRKRKFDGAATLAGFVVVDSHGEWMAEWKQSFAVLSIKTTRSHADLHPCPYDFKSLRAWAHQEHREAEPSFTDRNATQATNAIDT